MANSERSIDEAVAELEERSKRSRLILLIGTLIIVVSLVASAIQLNRLRAQEAARARTWEARAHHLEGLLKAAQAAYQTQRPNQANRLLQSAISQTGQLASQAAAVREGTKQETVQPNDSGPVRLYLHISEEGQRTAALQLESRLESATVGNRQIIVPGVELVPTRGTSSLRCLRQAECRYAGDLLRVIAERLAAPQVRVLDLSGQYGNRRVRPGTFELWLEAGSVEVN